MSQDDGRKRAVARRGVRAAVAMAVLALGALPRPAAADWPSFGRALSGPPANQQHAVVASDGADGAIAAWQDLGSPRLNIVAQHVLANGDLDPAWPVNGRVLLGDSLALAGAAGGQNTPAIVADGVGGAIVVWLDGRNDASGNDLFAQHVRADGTLDPAWPANGTAVTTAPGQQNAAVLAPDGKGGAIVAWVDGRVSADAPDIYAQHVLSDGTLDPAFPVDGLVVCDAPGPQGFPALISDGIGGAIITWHDDRAAAAGFDIYAQHVLSIGTVDPEWPVNGALVCGATGDQARPTIASDGADGAVVAWSDSRVVGTSHIFAQHVFGTGSADRAWPVNGRAVSAAALSESRPLAVPDGTGGAVIEWQGFTVHLNMYAQHVRADGTLDPVWPAGGRALSDRDREQTHAAIVPDGAGGAVVAWQDSFDVVAQHVRADGSFDPAYPDTGRAVVNLPSQQGDDAIVATSGGGAIVTWTDGRSGTDADIFALQVLNAGTVGVAPPAPGTGPGAGGPVLAAAAPNPARDALALHFTLSRETPVRLAIFDATGRRIRVLVSGARPAGGQSVDWDLRDDGGHAVRPGVYFARLDAEGRALTQKLVRTH